MPVVTAEALEKIAQRLFEAAGIPLDEAAQVARSLVLANLSGHDSHGAIRIIQYLKALAEGQLKAGVSLKIVQESPAVVVADGQWGLGQVQAHRLLDKLIPKAELTGIAAGTLKHCGHIGRLGEYAEAATSHGMAFWATVNNHGFARGVAPPGGKEARIGTNPLCIGAPAPADPVILDIGTSVVAEGKVRVIFNKGGQVPDGWLLDDQGQPTTDPGVLYREPRGSIQALGGAQSYKGFGLGMLLDMLVGGLSGGPCSHPELPFRSGNAVLFILMDPQSFGGVEHFMSQAQAITESVRSCPRASGVDAITLPGDPERQQKEKRQKEGIPLDEGTWSQILAEGEKLNVEIRL